MDTQKRALVVSGGASKGAYAGGVAQRLIEQCDNDYQLYLGTSAGSLLVPLLALGELNRVREVFTSVGEKDIFNICPFIIRKKDGGYSFRINHFNTLRMFLRGKKTFGESKNLRKLIRNTFTKTDYTRLRASGKEVLVTVSNLSCLAVEYKSIHDHSYEDFCDWMWISANIVPFMSLVVKNGMEYADGGFGDFLPLTEAIRRGASEIDAIILKPQDRSVQCFLPAGNAFGLLVRTFDFMLQEISYDDLNLGRLQSAYNEVELNCYHTPYVLTDNSLIFDAEQMTRWWELGYRHAEEVGPECRKIELGKESPNVKEP